MRRQGAVAALALAAFACAGPRPAGSPPARPDVLLVVVDTLRPDHLSLHGYPRPTSPELERAFAGAARFRSARSPVPYTSPAVASLLTGLVPARHRVRMVFQRLAAGVPALPDRLQVAGYATGAVVSNMVLTDEAMGLGARFDTYDDFVDEEAPWSGHRGGKLAWERNAARTTDAALAWLASAPAHRPQFLWVHYMDPHGPYAAPPDRPRTFAHEGRLAVDPERVPEYQRRPGAKDALDWVDRYDEEIAYVDREVGRLMAAYDRRPRSREAVVVFTADHGEAMAEHEKWFSHGHHVYEHGVRVPLLVRHRSIGGGWREEPVSLLDVAPTVLDLVGLPVGPIDGVSLLRPGRADREIALEGMGRRRGTQFRGVVRGRTKWVCYSEGGREEPGRRVAFDVETDPAETNPRPWPEPAPASLLAALTSDPDPSGLPRAGTVVAGRRLLGPKARDGGGLPAVPGHVDAETAERLRGLGYVQ